MTILHSTTRPWERWSRSLATWLPYVALAIATTVGTIQPGQTWADRAGTVGLSLVAAVWVFGMYTHAPVVRRIVAHPEESVRSRTVRTVVYFAGLLLLGTALMLRQPIYFGFLATGFLQTSDLRPWPLGIAGVATISTLINTILTGFPWTTTQDWLFFGTLIVIQTVMIGFGTQTGERLTDLSEQRRQAVLSLEAALEENAGLHAQLLTQAREAGVRDERQRLAGEIHDTLAQGLTGIITQLEAAERAEQHPERWRDHLGEARTLARASLTEARRSVQALRPEPLETVPLPAALTELARQWSKSSAVAARVETIGTARPLLPEIEATLFRIAQESLTNVARHAGASRVGITLSYIEEVVVLDVRDDGQGFDVARAGTERQCGSDGGFGLAGMEQRLRRVAGSLTIESAIGAGTAISATVPAIMAGGGSR